MAQPTIPLRVLANIEAAITTLREIASQFTSARTALHGPLGGGGRYEADVLTNRADDITWANQRLAHFRELAPRNGVDAEAVLTGLGGVPDLTPSSAAADWLRDATPRTRQVRTARIGCPSIVQDDAETILSRRCFIVVPKS